MSEPRAVAGAWFELVPGVLHWTVHDERIDFRSDSFAVAEEDGWVLIDPLPLAGGAVDALERVVAIVLTVAAHQRAAWSFRRTTGAPVSAPRGSVGLAEVPDRLHDPGSDLVGGLRVLAAPGPKGAHHALLRDLDGGGRALFTGDLLVRPPSGPPVLTPDEHLEDLEAARATARTLAGLGPTVLALGHGAPVLEAAGAALSRAADDG